MTNTIQTGTNINRFILSKLLVISSYPHVLLAIRDLIMSLFSCATVDLYIIFEKQLLKTFNQYTGKGKGKVYPRTDHEGPEGE